MQKFLFASGFSLLILLNSCTTTLVSSQNGGTVENSVKTGKTYTFKDNTGQRYNFKVESITKDKITGSNSDGQRFTIDKNNISTVKKIHTGKTMLLTAGVIAVAVLLPAYIKNEPVGK